MFSGPDAFHIAAGKKRGGGGKDPHWLAPSRVKRAMTPKQIVDAIKNRPKKKKERQASDDQTSASRRDDKKTDGPSEQKASDSLSDSASDSKHRNQDTPSKGEPNSTLEGQKRTREYGPDGKPVRDYDKPHQGHQTDHVHEWPNGKREEPGRPYSPWPKDV